jgi:hypothetical protein
MRKKVYKQEAPKRRSSGTIPRHETALGWKSECLRMMAVFLYLLKLHLRGCKSQAYLERVVEKPGYSKRAVCHFLKHTQTFVAMLLL